jgi:hypothetical protein
MNRREGTSVPSCDRHLSWKVAFPSEIVNIWTECEDWCNGVRELAGIAIPLLGNTCDILPVQWIGILDWSWATVVGMVSRLFFGGYVHVLVRRLKEARIDAQ